jgi:ABC-type Fe3+-hydroxamate transport system substrate-binding protein
MMSALASVPRRWLDPVARLGELVVGLEEKIDQVADRLDAIEKAVRTRTARKAG